MSEDLNKAFPHDWGEGVTRRLRSKLLVTEEGCYLGANQTNQFISRKNDSANNTIIFIIFSLTHF